MKMRPPKERQNRLLHPLNEVFGTEANVRLLRVLALQHTAMTTGELAKRARLGRTSIYPALRELERSEVVEFIGAGARKLVQLRDRYPLSRILRELFRAEARRFEALTLAVRELLSTMPRTSISAWMNHGGENPDATDTLALYIVARPKELNTMTDYLNERLADIERKYDVRIEVHGLMPSEVETFYRTRLETPNLVLLGGVPPLALVERSRPAPKTSTLVSHEEHDARSRRLAVAIAAKIRRDPGLIAVAEERIKRRAREASPRERRELAEWLRVLSSMSPARLRRLLLENSERAVRLRQTLPALNFLSPTERDAVIRSQTDADVIAAITDR